MHTSQPATSAVAEDHVTDDVTKIVSSPDLTLMLNTCHLIGSQVIVLVRRSAHQAEPDPPTIKRARRNERPGDRRG